MSTQYLHRMLIICPVDKAIDFNAWIKANLNPEGEDWFSGAGLGKNSDVSHYWCNVALTDTELKLINEKLCDLANIKKPKDWDKLDKDQKKQDLETNRDEILDKCGIRIFPMSNNEDWVEPETELESAKLEIIVREERIISEIKDKNGEK